MSGRRVEKLYRQRLEASDGYYRDARARVWRFVFDCYAKKKGGEPSTANDGKEIEGVPANPILPQRRQL